MRNRFKYAIILVVTILTALFAVGCEKNQELIFEEETIITHEELNENDFFAAFAPAEGYEVSENDLSAAAAVIETRLELMEIAGFEVNANLDDMSISIRFPEQDTLLANEEITALLREPAVLTFREHSDNSFDFTYDDRESFPVILTGDDIAEAFPYYGPAQHGGFEWYVSIVFNEIGAEKFTEATKRLVDCVISIWLDDALISAPTVTEPIIGGQAVLSGNMTDSEAAELAIKINAGALPYEMVEIF